MSEDNPIRDEDLLANAIPIDPSELEEDEGPASSGDVEDLDTPLELDEIPDAAEQTTSGRSITTFGSQRRHEDTWNRTPNAPGTGAIHVKTFVTKLRLDAIAHMDQQVNEWLDAHPQYEVKFVSSSVGKLVGKNTEEALFVSVWV